MEQNKKGFSVGDRDKEAVKKAEDSTKKVINDFFDGLKKKI